jgi:integrase
MPNAFAPILRSFTAHKHNRRVASSLLLTPVPLHALLAEFLQEWKNTTPYFQPENWVFASFKLKGRQPRTANMLVEDHLPPAAIRAGVLTEGEKVRFGFHNLRHYAESETMPN